MAELLRGTKLDNAACLGLKVFCPDNKSGKPAIVEARLLYGGKFKVTRSLNLLHMA